jgi:hypothetical protein
LRPHNFKHCAKAIRNPNRFFVFSARGNAFASARLVIGNLKIGSGLGNLRM